MQNLEKLAELAKAIEGENGSNAADLVERMGEVIEGIGDKPIEWRPDTLKLVQGTSDRGKLPKGAGIGSIVVGEDILDQPTQVIPIRLWTSRQYWNPDPEKAQMLCSSPDGIAGFNYGDCKLCPYSKFDQENNRSQCNKTLTFLLLSADLSRLFFANFSKSAYSQGMDFSGLIKKAGVSPYKRVYNLSSMTSPKSKNVEVLKAEPIVGAKVEGAELAFVEELFRITSEDRKQALERFHEGVNARKSNNLLAGPPDEHTITLIPADDDVDAGSEATVVVEEAAPSAKTKDKKYAV